MDLQDNASTRITPPHFDKLHVQELGRNDSKRLLDYDPINYGITHRPKDFAPRADGTIRVRLAAGWLDIVPPRPNQIIVRTSTSLYRVVRRRQRESFKSLWENLPPTFQRVQTGVVVNISRIVWYDLRFSLKNPWVAFEVTPPTPRAVNREMVFVSDEGRRLLRDLLGLRRKRPSSKRRVISGPTRQTTKLRQIGQKKRRKSQRVA